MANTTESPKKIVNLKSVGRAYDLIDFSDSPKERCQERIPTVLFKAIKSCCKDADWDWPLFVYGEAGTGKTCASLWLCDWVPGSRYVTQPDFLSAMNKSRLGQLMTSNGYPYTEKEIWGNIEKASLLVLDEIGQRTDITDYQQECIKRLLDLRENKPTIYISNYPLNDIANHYDDRIASRLSSGTVVCVDADDQRLGKKFKED